MIYLYLLAIVAANLSVAHFGPSVLPYTAFILIPFDMVTRDHLHVKWKSESKFYLNKMLMLVSTGSLISLLLNYDAKAIAAASFFAFLISGLLDTIVFELLSKKNFFFRVNMSNMASALADSIVFPLVAFGALDPQLMSKQATAKFVGGVVWAGILSIYFKKELSCKR